MTFGAGSGLPPLVLVLAVSCANPHTQAERALSVGREQCERGNAAICVEVARLHLTEKRLDALSDLVGDETCARSDLPPDAMASGGLPRQHIADVVTLHRSEIVYCYERALGPRQGQSGIIQMGFTIGPSGKVISTKVEADELRMPEVGQCLVEQIGRWRFRCPVGGGPVHGPTPSGSPPSSGTAGPE